MLVKTNLEVTHGTLAFAIAETTNAISAVLGGKVYFHRYMSQPSPKKRADLIAQGVEWVVFCRQNNAMMKTETIVQSLSGGNALVIKHYHQGKFGHIYHYLEKPSFLDELTMILDDKIKSLSSKE